MLEHPVTFPISDIEAGAQYRKEGYKDECLKRGRLSDDGEALELSDEDHAYIRANFSIGFPSFRQMAKTATAAAVKTAELLAQGKPIYVEDIEFQRRVEICNGCDLLDKDSMRCRKCGCRMDAEITGKARLVVGECPLGKW
jgi:hypothetical protein